MRSWLGMTVDWLRNHFLWLEQLLPVSAAGVISVGQECLGLSFPGSSLVAFHSGSNHMYHQLLRFSAVSYRVGCFSVAQIFSHVVFS